MISCIFAHIITRMNKVAIIWFTAFSILTFVSCRHQEEQIQPLTDSAESASALQEDSLGDAPDVFTVVGTGDIVLGLNYPEHAPRIPSGDGAHLFDSVKHILEAADVTFGNLEGVLLDSGGIPKKCSDSSLCFRFRMPERYVNHLISAGYDVMSVANNHVFDFGQEARNHTLDILDQVGLKHAGSLSRPYTILERHGVRFGFCAFAAMYGCCSIFNETAAQKIIQELRPQCDVLIVSMHAGQEGSAHTHVPFSSEYQQSGTLGDVHHFAHLCVDAGADIFFGHGPHVARAVELYNDRFIAYSLGNFCTPFGMVISGVSGYAPIIQVSVDRNGHFVAGQIYAARQSWGVGPRLDAQRRVIQEIKRLTQEDFPQTPLQITDEGSITKK